MQRVCVFGAGASKFFIYYLYSYFHFAAFLCIKAADLNAMQGFSPLFAARRYKRLKQAGLRRGGASTGLEAPSLRRQHSL